MDSMKLSRNDAGATSTSTLTPTTKLSVVVDSDGLQNNDDDNNNNNATRRISSNSNNKRRHVHWSASNVHVYDHLHRHDFTIEERSSYWFSDDEFTEMLNHPMTQVFILKQMFKRGFSTFLNYTSSSKTK